MAAKRVRPNPSILARVVAAEPGARFEARYRRTQQTQRSRAKRIAWLSVGVLLVAVGLFFLVAPGPGILFLIPGAALISQEWIGLDRTLDRGEIWLRRRLRLSSDRAAGTRGSGKPRP